MKTNTVNVIEFDDGAILSLYSFIDNEEGNKEAEELFYHILETKNINGDDIAIALENGIYEQGSYSLFITHSQ